MAIKKDQLDEMMSEKNGMRVRDNMDGEKRADDKLMAKISFGKELDKLPGNTIQEKLERALGIKVMPNIPLKDALKLLRKNKK